MAGYGDGQTIAAQISVRRGRSAIEFYKAAFGAIEDYRVGGTDDEPAVVAQLSVGKTAFWVADESPPHDNFSPESLGGSTTRMLLIAEDPQGVIDRAVAAGATEIYPASEAHGWLLGGSKTRLFIIGRSDGHSSTGVPHRNLTRSTGERVAPANITEFS